jgi:hypothetical protein
MTKTHDVYQIGQREDGNFYIAIQSYDGINLQSTDYVEEEFESHDDAVRELEERASIAAEAEGVEMRHTNGDTIRVTYAI